MEVLAEQIDYLRAINRMPHITPRTPGLNPSEQPPASDGLPLHVPDEEEDIEALHSYGHISDHEAEQLRAELREMGVELPPLTVET